MLEPDVVIYTNQITFMVDQDDIKNDGKVTFDYIVATDYKETLISVEAREFSSKAFQNTLEISKHQTEEYFWFEVDVTEGIARSSDNTITLEITEYHKRRREPVPKAITVMEDQTLEYIDSKYLLSPYLVMS